MPELPEVEITCRGIAPHIIGKTITQIVIRQPRLRYPIAVEMAHELPMQTIKAVTRRGKYILISIDSGTLIVHLGMSGSLRVISVDVAPHKHDHFDIVFDKQLLRLRDPRRFGTILWTPTEPMRHPLLASLGHEPLDDLFTGEYLYAAAQRRSGSVKSFIMDSHVVVGVGNIYANEALFTSGIHPLRAAQHVSKKRYQHLQTAIRQVLTDAIEHGGTTLRDFVKEDGNPGYFRNRLQIYGRHNLPCVRCTTPIKRAVIGQRASYYCSQCQH